MICNNDLPSPVYIDSYVRPFKKVTTAPKLTIAKNRFLCFQNMSVELQFENHAEFSQDFFKSQVDKAAGARYGTGERAL